MQRLVSDNESPVKNKTKVKSKKAKVVSDGEPDEMQEMIDKAKSKRKKKKF